MDEHFTDICFCEIFAHVVSWGSFRFCFVSLFFVHSSARCDGVDGKKSQCKKRKNKIKKKMFIYLDKPCKMFRGYISLNESKSIQKLRNLNVFCLRKIHVSLTLNSFQFPRLKMVEFLDSIINLLCAIKILHDKKNSLNSVSLSLSLTISHALSLLHANKPPNKHNIG